MLLSALKMNDTGAQFGYAKLAVWFVALAVLAVGGRGVQGGSCREATLCCNGRDSSCVVQKAPINAINEDFSEKPCYCDHACLKLGDCCTDFKQHCGGDLNIFKYKFMIYITLHYSNFSI